MNVVWPVTALYMGPLAICAYRTMGDTGKTAGSRPFWQKTFVGTTHCGSGCTLGDIIAEFWVFYGGLAFFGASAVGVFGTYLVMSYALAYVLGIAFQYFNIAPMRGVWGMPSLWAAIKADTLSLTAFEVGLFGWMALMHFVIFQPRLEPNQAAYWFMMQIGMCIGFLTSYPMNWWLVKVGIKEAM
ncbi:MAG TPA: DUF4396 domain-containing protein [Candidatus Cybelea sp.]|nr:DUF4396 domain-containing protein [Candidatus Cybelea sp.]